MTDQQSGQHEGGERLMDYATFLKWERASRDTIDFKTIYVDMAGDLVAGLLLSQIVYWNLPDAKGRTKLRVFREDQYWLAKAHDDWYEEIRIPGWTVKRKLNLLRERGFIETKMWRFNGLRMTHIRVIPEAFLAAWEVALESYGLSEEDNLALADNPVIPVGTNCTDRREQIAPTEEDRLSRPLTETTAETKNRDHDNNNNTVVDDSDSSQSQIPERQVLKEMRLATSVQRELLKLPHIDGPYLARWLEWMQHGDHAGVRSVSGLAVSAIRNGDEPPAPPVEDDPHGFNEAARRRAAKRDAKWEAANQADPQLQRKLERLSQ